MTNRQQIIAGHVNSLSISKNGSILSAMVTGGPVSAQGRGVRVVLADDTLRGMLAHLALDARWAAALMALGQSARVLASSRELQHFPGTVGERAELTERMKRAMDTQDADLAEAGVSPYDNNGVHRLNLPATAPEGEGEMYAALAAFGGTVVHAEAGCVTELVRPDGTVAARVVPA